MSEIWAYQEKSDIYTHIVRTADGSFICQLGQDPTGLAERRARLIAAAPEMAELLARVGPAIDAYFAAGIRTLDALGVRENTDLPLEERMALGDAADRARSLVAALATDSRALLTRITNNSPSPKNEDPTP